MWHELGIVPLQTLNYDEDRGDSVGSDGRAGRKNIAIYG
jgi:hypothetical protein